MDPLLPQVPRFKDNLTHQFTPASFLPPSVSFDHVHIDLVVGPLPHSDTYRYILSCVDRFSRWLEATPITDINTTTIAKTFINTWISRYGVPTTNTSDRGSQFESILWNKIMTLLGIKRLRTTSYHPQSNGLVERFHRQLKSALMFNLHHLGEWSSSLSLSLSRLTSSKSALQPTPPRQATTKTLVSQDLQTCTHVFVRVVIRHRQEATPTILLWPLPSHPLPENDHYHQPSWQA